MGVGLLTLLALCFADPPRCCRSCLRYLSLLLLLSMTRAACIRPSRAAAAFLQLRRCDAARCLLHPHALSARMPSHTFATAASVEGRNRPKITFVLGGPGAGKGTQSERLADEFNLAHLSAGELLRKEQNSGSESGNLINAYLREGRIVPVEVSLRLLKREIVARAQERYIIDGFPRNEDNLRGWNLLMSDTCDVECVYYFTCNESELERRILARGRLSNRSDDNLATIRKRMLSFHQDTMPVIDFYRSTYSATSQFWQIKGDGSVDEVYAKFRQTFQSVLQADLEQQHKELLAALRSNCLAQLSAKYSSTDAWDQESSLGNSLDFHALEAEHTRVSFPSATTALQRFAVLRKAGGKVDVTRKWVLVDGGWRVTDVSCTG